MEDHATATVWMYMPEGMTDVAVKGNLSPIHQPQAKISNYLRGGKKNRKKTKQSDKMSGSAFMRVGVRVETSAPGEKRQARGLC